MDTINAKQANIAAMNFWDRHRTVSVVYTNWKSFVGSLKDASQCGAFVMVADLSLLPSDKRVGMAKYLYGKGYVCTIDGVYLTIKW